MHGFGISGMEPSGSIIRNWWLSECDGASACAKQFSPSVDI
jgi:hypothetical protein